MDLQAFWQRLSMVGKALFVVQAISLLLLATALAGAGSPSVTGVIMVAWIFVAGDLLRRGRRAASAAALAFLLVLVPRMVLGALSGQGIGFDPDGILQDLLLIGPLVFPPAVAWAMRAGRGVLVAMVAVSGLAVAHRVATGGVFSAALHEPRLFVSALVVAHVMSAMLLVADIRGARSPATTDDPWRVGWTLAVVATVSLSWIMQGRAFFPWIAGIVLVVGGFAWVLHRARSAETILGAAVEPSTFLGTLAVGLLQIWPCRRFPYGLRGGDPSAFPASLIEVALHGPEWTKLQLDAGHNVICAPWVYGVAVAWIVALVGLVWLRSRGSGVGGDGSRV